MPADNDPTAPVLRKRGVRAFRLGIDTKPLPRLGLRVRGKCVRTGAPPN
jgi:hypothetical protein